MRVTVDIPDLVYRELKSQAVVEGRSVGKIILQRMTQQGHHAPGTNTAIKFPRIKARKPGSLNLGPEGVYEYIPFP